MAKKYVGAYFQIIYVKDQDVLTESNDNFAYWNKLWDSELGMGD